MSEIVTSSSFPGTEQWRTNTIRLARASYSTWITEALQLHTRWLELCSDKVWEKSFDDEPKTEERFRREVLDVRSEEFWTLFLQLTKLIDQDRERQDLEEKEQSRLRQKAQQRKKEELKNRRRRHRRKLRTGYTESELDDRVDGILCADYGRNKRNYKCVA